MSRSVVGVSAVEAVVVGVVIVEVFFVGVPVT